MKDVIGRRLAIECSRLGLTDGKAAKAAGCSRRTWVNYESGNTTPDAVMLKKREGRERAEARKKIKELAEAHGIDLATLAPSGSGKPEPKYRNPNDKFQTWSGVGRKPKWVEEWLAAGKPLEELAIN